MPIRQGGVRSYSFFFVVVFHPVFVNGSSAAGLRQMKIVLPSSSALVSSYIHEVM